MPNQIEISPRTVFLDTNGVRAARGWSADHVNAAIDSGDLLWVFDLSCGRGKKHLRELRFWFPEIVNSKAVAKLELAEVILKILPWSRTTFNSSELCQWFLLSRPTMMRIGRELSGFQKNRMLRVQRAPLANYLKKHWIGGALCA